MSIADNYIELSQPDGEKVIADVGAIKALKQHGSSTMLIFTGDRTEVADHIDSVWLKIKNAKKNQQLINANKRLSP